MFLISKKLQTRASLYLQHNPRRWMCSITAVLSTWYVVLFKWTVVWWVNQFRRDGLKTRENPISPMVKSDTLWRLKWLKHVINYHFFIYDMVNGYKWPIKYDYFARSVNLFWAERLINLNFFSPKNHWTYTAFMQNNFD